MLGNLRMRADAGDPEAQFQLAQALQLGLGIPIDESEALSLYHSAAAMGYERAQFVLGEICMEGRITPQDLVRSYMWFSRVLDGGGELSPAAANSCQELASYLSPEQLSEAIQSANDVSFAIGNDQ